MLQIRREQMDVFRAAARQSFEDEMVLHLSEFSPSLAKTLRVEQLHDVVRLGMERAAGYGFDHRGPVRLFLESMLLFGSYFDTDPQYPWAAEILTDAGTPQTVRARQLYLRVMDYQERVAGPDDTYAAAALRNIRAFAARPLNFSPTELVPAMLHELELIYPEKVSYVGADALSVMIRRGGQGARNVRFYSPRATALVIVLMLAFGHRCGADPLYPWIANTLRDDRAQDPEAKAGHLEKKALIWLDHVLAGGDEAAPA
jgi:hypothetical protein